MEPKINKEENISHSEFSPSLFDPLLSRHPRCCNDKKKVKSQCCLSCCRWVQSEHCMQSDGLSLNKSLHLAGTRCCSLAGAAVDTCQSANCLIRHIHSVSLDIQSAPLGTCKAYHLIGANSFHFAPAKCIT